MEKLENITMLAGYHEESEKEKLAKINHIANMQPGDEFSYVVKQDIPGVCKAGKYHFVCTFRDTEKYFLGPNIELNKIDVISKNNDKAENVGENYAKIDQETLPFFENNLVKVNVNSRTTYLSNTQDKFGNLSHNSNIPLKLIRDIKIIPGRFNKEELKTLKSGREVNYDDVCERGNTLDAKEYINYLVDQHTQTTTSHSASDAKTLKALPNQEKKAAIDTLTKVAEEVKTEGRWGAKIGLCCETLAKAIDSTKTIEKAIDVAKAQITHYSSFVKKEFETTIREIATAIKDKYPSLNKEVSKAEEKKPIVKVVRRKNQRGENQR